MECMCIQYSQIIVPKDTVLQVSHTRKLRKSPRKANKDMELTPGSLSETIKQSEIKQYLHLIRSSCLSTKTAILNWRESSFKTTMSRSNSLEKEYGNVTVLLVYYCIIKPDYFFPGFCDFVCSSIL